jgi:MbtH protein
MSNDAEIDDSPHQVVINDEEQYSIWPLDRALPPGWHAVGKQGARRACLEYIDEVWTDMRPKSLRDAEQRSTS